MAARFVVMLVINSLVALMYYLWQWGGISQAGDVFLFMIWFGGIGGLLILFARPDGKQHRPKLPIHGVLSGVFSVAFLIGTIWAGHIVAAVFYCAGALIARGYFDRCEGLAKGDAG